MSTVKIKQLNCQKAKACNVFIAHEMIQGEMIFLVQEPYLYKGKVCGMPSGYEIFGVQYARAVIIAHKSLGLCFCPELSDKDTTVCLTKYSNKRAYLVSSYLDILLPPVGEKLDKLKNELLCNDSVCIAGIDSNAHSHLWNCEITNTRGEELEAFIMENNFMVHNQGNENTFVTRRACSIIDITISYGNVEISDWNVSEKYSYSDHKLIECVFVLYTLFPPFLGTFLRA